MPLPLLLLLLLLGCCVAHSKREALAEIVSQQQQRDYLDGKLQKPEEPDSLRFDAEAWSKKDAAICSLSCEMAPGLLDFICSKQSERPLYRIRFPIRLLHKCEQRPTVWWRP